MASSRRSLANHCLILVLARGRGDEGQPVPGRPGSLRLRGEDLDDVAGLQLALQRDQPAVHPRADAAVPDLGVHRVGEVDRRRAGRQRDHVALRREDEDLLRGQVVAQRLEEVAGVRGLPLPVQQLAHPAHLVDLDGLPARRAARCAPRRLLVPPVRGDAVLGGAVHVVGADLHLERLAVRPDHGGVQRLVDAEPRLRDVVLEPAGHRLPQRVHHAHRGVAVAHLVDEHAHARPGRGCRRSRGP